MMNVVRAMLKAKAIYEQKLTANGFNDGIT